MLLIFMAASKVLIDSGLIPPGITELFLPTTETQQANSHWGFFVPTF